MTERYQAGIVQQSNMEPQNEGLTARPESGRNFLKRIPEKARILADGAKDVMRLAKTNGVKTFAAVTIIASSTLAACGWGKAEDFNENVTPPPATVIPRDPTSSPTPEFTIVPITETSTEKPTTVVPTDEPTDEPTQVPTDTATPDPTDTSEPTVEPTDEPTEKPTEPPQTETPKPTKTPAPTDTPTATETAVESELPYEIGWEKTFGNITLAIEKDLLTRTECPDTQNLQNMKACNAMHELYLNTKDFPDAAERFEEFERYGFYRAWINQGQGDKADRKKMTFDEFKTELANERGQDLTFQITGPTRQGNHDIIGITTIDPRVDHIAPLWLAQPTAWSWITTAAKMEIRKIGNKVWLPMYQFDAGGVGNEDPQQKNPSRWRASEQIMSVLVYLITPSLQTQNPNSPAQKELMRDLVTYLVPNFENGDLSSIVMAK